MLAKRSIRSLIRRAPSSGRASSRLQTRSAASKKKSARLRASLPFNARAAAVCHLLVEDEVAGLVGVGLRTAVVEEALGEEPDLFLVVDGAVEAPVVRPFGLAEVARTRTCGRIWSPTSRRRTCSRSFASSSPRSAARRTPPRSGPRTSAQARRNPWSML